jgi:peptide/nickel transport system substrate-binding protein
VVVTTSADMGRGLQDAFFFYPGAKVWQPLVGLDDALRPTPVLAERWDLSPDGLTWTFKLRPNVRFSDGTPFDGGVVVRNLQRYIAISPRPGAVATMDVKVGYGNLVGADAVDPMTVAFRLATPAPAMPATMSGVFSAMFHPDCLAENGDFVSLPLGTGPYRAVDWRQDQFLLLERNERYAGPAPAVRRVRYRVIPDVNARASALLAGEVDAVAGLGALLPAQAPQLKSQRGVTVGADPINLSQYLSFNCARPAFDDVRLRRAVLLATDRDTIVKDLLLGYATPGKTLLSPLSRWASPKGAPRYDPAEAKRLAQEALGGRRVEASLAFTNFAGQARPYKATGELMQAWLRPLGIDLVLQGTESAAHNDQLTRGDWNARFNQIAWANGDPDYIFDDFLRSTSRYQALFKGGYENEEVDALIVAGKSERDENKRFQIYERLQELALRDVAVAPLYHEHVVYAHRDTVVGLRHTVTYEATIETMRRAR